MKLRHATAPTAENELGPPVVPFTLFLGGGFPYQHRLQTKNGTLILTPLLEGLVEECGLSGGLLSSRTDPLDGLRYSRKQRRGNLVHPQGPCFCLFWVN